MFDTQTMDKIKANTVTSLHFLWTFLLLGGAVLMFFNRWFAYFEITIMTITVIANFPFKGNCPLTLLEERLRQKIDPTYNNQNSFMTTYLNKIFGTNLKVSIVNTYIILLYIVSYCSAILLIIHK